MHRLFAGFKFYPHSRTININILTQVRHNEHGITLLLLTRSRLDCCDLKSSELAKGLERVIKNKQRPMARTSDANKSSRNRTHSEYVCIYC